MPAIVSTTSPVGTPPSQIGPSAVALPFSSSTLYVPDPSRRTPPVSSAVVIVYTTRTLNDCWTKMPRPLSYVNSLQPFPFTRVHDCPIVRSWLSTIARPLPIAFSLLRMTVMWSEAVTWTPFEPNLLMLSSSRRMALEPSIRIPTDPPASPEFESTARSEEHTSELQSPCNLVCRLLLEKKKHYMCPQLQRSTSKNRKQSKDH